jgi:hypothetical protein
MTITERDQISLVDIPVNQIGVLPASAPAVAGLPGGLHNMGMTGKVSPGADAGSGARPELRASHEDRDRAVEILRVAAGDGRLTAAELDERIEAALTARTSGRLAELTADLPAVPGQADSVTAQAKDVIRLDYQGGNATRRGQWAVPARMEIRAVGGTVKLDFTDAVITHPTLQIQAYVRGGGLVLVTKPGIEVDADGITVHGGTVKIRPRNGWKEPVRLAIEVSGENHGGRVTARPPRRTFRQWLLHRPRPHARSIRN